jgi:ribosomal protein L16 Arg81 hydroxylase
LSKFPELPKARGIAFEVGPGDVLYLPPFWFHQVESLDDSISLSALSLLAPACACLLTNFIH